MCRPPAGTRLARGESLLDSCEPGIVVDVADPRLVLLVVLAGPPGGETMNGAVVGSAVRDALGDETRVLVDDRKSELTDAEASATAVRIRADAVASIGWMTPNATRAHVHMFVTADALFYDRELSFQTADTVSDRERAVGLLIGAMVRSARAESPPDAVREELPPAAPTAPPPNDVIAEPTPAVRPAAKRRALAVEAAAVATAGLGGPALGAGPQLRAAWFPTSWLALRAGGSVAFGAIPDADASTSSYRMTAGAGSRIASFAGASGSLEVGANVVVVDHRVARTAPEAVRERWITGGQLGVRLGWMLSSTIESFGSVGVELVPGRTPIVVDGRTLATIPPARATAELGVALRF